MIDIHRRVCFLCKDVIATGQLVGQIVRDHAHYGCVARFLRQQMSR